MSKAAERLLDVIDAISVADAPLAVSEVTQLTGLNKSTASRILQLLADRDYVTRDDDSRRYRVGPTLLGLSATTAKRSELIRIAHPYLEMIRNESGETTSLHLRVMDERLCIDAVDRFPPQLHIQPLGLRSPLYVGTSGKVIVAHLDPSARARLVEEAGFSGADAGELARELEFVHDRGFLVGISPKTQRHTTISAPLFRDSRVFGSVTITGPHDRWTQSAAGDYAERLKEHSETISAVVSNARVFVYQTSNGH